MSSHVSLDSVSISRTFPQDCDPNYKFTTFVSLSTTFPWTPSPYHPYSYRSPPHLFRKAQSLHPPHSHMPLYMDPSHTQSLHRSTHDLPTDVIIITSTPFLQTHVSIQLNPVSSISISSTPLQIPITISTESLQVPSLYQPHPYRSLISVPTTSSSNLQPGPSSVLIISLQTSFLYLLQHPDRLHLHMHYRWVCREVRDTPAGPHFTRFPAKTSFVSFLHLSSLVLLIIHFSRCFAHGEFAPLYSMPSLPYFSPLMGDDSLDHRLDTLHHLLKSSV